jgi:hypothetical protein
MSKKSKRKNRPKRRPVQREVNKPESNPLITRRRAILTLAGAGGAAAAWRAGLFDVFGDEEKPQESTKQDSSKKSTTGPRLPEYDEWASKIELPDIEYNPYQTPWTKEQIENHFIPKEVDRESLPPFYKTFDDLTDDLLAGLKNKSEPKERNDLINSYLGQIFELLFSGNLNTLDKDQLKEAISKTSRILIPHGYWIGGDREYGEAFNKYVIYGIDKINSLKVHLGDQSGDLPVVSLKEKQDITADTDAEPIVFNGTYFHDNGCIIVDDNQIAESMASVSNFEELCRELNITPRTNNINVEFFRRVTLMHEGMHAVSHKMSQKNPEPARKIDTKGINMGHYTLNPKMFGSITEIDVDELIANGFGILNSGDLAHLTLYNIQTSARSNPTYNFCSFVILNEILNSPSLDPSSKNEFFKELSSGKISDKDFVKFLMKIPPHELTNIGERMAKLGIYLTQE